MRNTIHDVLVLPALLIFSVSNKALVIHAYVKEGQGVNASVNGALLPPPPQDGPAPNPDIQVQSCCRWQGSNLSLECTQKGVSFLHDQL